MQPSIPPNCRQFAPHAGRAATLVCGLSALFFAAAFAQRVTTEFDQVVDFTRYKTFAVRGGEIRSPRPELNSELTKKRIEADIETALTARGLTKSGGAADLNVYYTLGSRGGIESEVYPPGWRGPRTRVVRSPYVEGNLVIDLRDPTTRSLVWRGVATREESNPATLTKKLDDMVRKTIARYPPKK